MRCFYVLKKWSSAKLSLNRDLSLNKMSLNWDCTVLMIDSIRKKSTSTYNRNLRVFSIRCLPFYRCKMYFPLLCLSILFASVASQDESLFEIGDFQNLAHGISGKVFVKDEKTLIIKGKVYQICS